ncbi:MAG: hypothetical protein GY702_10630 [Desulfobulbaceae bacterium]|nr:hypothetical protein [Desulfobulbaceae bacterium]
MEDYTIEEQNIIKATWSLQNDAEAYQLINALYGLAFAFVERMAPEAPEKEKWFNTVNLVKDSIISTMDAPPLAPKNDSGHGHC